MEIGELGGESSHNPRFSNSRQTMQKLSGASRTERKKNRTTT
jgi:hypothetical protein